MKFDRYFQAGNRSRAIVRQSSGNVCKLLIEKIVGVRQMNIREMNSLRVRLLRRSKRQFLRHHRGLLLVRAVRRDEHDNPDDQPDHQHSRQQAPGNCRLFSSPETDS